MGTTSEVVKAAPEILALLTKMEEIAGPPTAAPAILPDPDGDGVIVAVRQGYAVAHYPGPTKNRRVHKFYDLESFASWLKRHVAAGDEDAVEILVGETDIKAGIAPKDPRGDVVSCVLKNHPQFESWRAIFGRPMDQKSLHAFVRGNLPTFEAVPLTNGEPSGVSSGELLASELLKVKFAAGVDVEAVLDERGFYQVNSSGTRQDLAGKIPPRFRIRTPILMGVKNGEVEVSYGLEILLSLEIGDGKATFVLSCPSLNLALHQARLDAVAYLKQLLGEFYLVGMGELTMVEVPAASTV